MASSGASGVKKEENSEKIMSSFGLPRLWHTVDISSDKFLLPEEKLNHPPSLLDGMEVETERDLRFLGCELIQAAGILLKMPQVAAATAQILYQRYFYSKSFVRNNFEDTAMACLVLASKIEESPRRNRDIINVFHHLKQLSRQKAQADRKIGPLILDQTYISIKNRVIKAERRVLKELGFVVHVKHPHKLITGYLKALDLDRSKTIIQKSWNYMNDGLRTDIFVRYTAETIACACIYLAARVCKVPLPMEPLPWWELFSAQETEIVDISKILLSQYTKTKTPSWRRLEGRVGEIRERLQERQKAKTQDSTPPTTQSNDRFSPSAGSRAVSPGKHRKQENGEPTENHRRGKDHHRATQGHRRSRSHSQESSPPSVRKKQDLPKRYSSTKERRSEKKRRRSRSATSPPFRSKANRPTGEGERERKQKRAPKTQRPERVVSASPPAPKIKEKGKNRDKNSRVARKEREREVKMAMGKRRRSPGASPQPERREKSGKYR